MVDVGRVHPRDLGHRNSRLDRGSNFYPVQLSFESNYDLNQVL